MVECLSLKYLKIKSFSKLSKFKTKTHTKTLFYINLFLANKVKSNKT